MADEPNWKDKIIQSKLGGKTEWTERERTELCLQLDKEFSEKLKTFENQPKHSNLGAQWTEENWEEKMLEHPIFAPFVLGKDGRDQELPLDNDLSEGLAQLKYGPDHNSPLEMAGNYKEEGLFYFKLKKYDFAITSFSEGLKQNFDDDVLKAQLYNNVAAAHYHLGNYRSAINNCHKAILLKKDYDNAIQNAIKSANSLSSWKEVIDWCDIGLQLQQLQSKYEQLLKKRTEAVHHIKVADWKLRKEIFKEKLKLAEHKKLTEEIAKRNIKMKTNPPSMEDLRPKHHAAENSPVKLTEDGHLVWPVQFLYPEYNESDCVLEFHENASFLEHLRVIFAQLVQWDIQQQYRVSNLKLFYKERFNGHFIEIDLNQTLRDVLSDQRYLLEDGFPSFVVMASNSPFTKSFLKERL